MNELKTITITNLGGPLTRRADGDINSGLAKFDVSWGYDPYSRPGNLTWMEQPTSILTLQGGAGPIVAAEQRLEDVGSTGVAKSVVYAIDNVQKLYKILVSTDTPSVISTFPNVPGNELGPDMVFYGNTEKIFYGASNVIQKVNFDGSAPTSIYGVSSVVTAVPRPMTTFLGKIYFGNGNNIGEIDNTELITTGAKLSPALPTGTCVRDLDVTPDGNYLQITATRNTPISGYITPAADPSATTGSYRFLWNGVDTSFTAFESYEGTGLTANSTFADKNYAMGYDSTGTAVYLGHDKLISMPKSTAAFPPGLAQLGNTIGIAVSEYDIISRTMKAALFYHGRYDEETPGGLFRLLRLGAPAKTDVISLQVLTNVSNLQYSPSYLGGPTDTFAQGKVYFSTNESSSSSQNDYEQHLWKFSTVPTGQSSVVAGVYETQSQIFSKKVAVKAVRLYTAPLIADNSFTLDLIGSGGSVMSGGSQIFTVGTNVTAGDDKVEFNPQVEPTYTVGVRITNSSVLGTANWEGMKLELDVVEAGR